MDVSLLNLICFIATSVDFHLPRYTSPKFPSNQHQHVITINSQPDPNFLTILISLLEAFDSNLSTLFDSTLATLFNSTPDSLCEGEMINCTDGWLPFASDGSWLLFLLTIHTIASTNREHTKSPPTAPTTAHMMVLSSLDASACSGASPDCCVLVATTPVELTEVVLTEVVEVTEVVTEVVDVTEVVVTEVVEVEVPVVGRATQAPAKECVRYLNVT
jgi:hypothetical protein